jgi:pimeloyl-ACP methyl ester carboxylesterase
MTKWFILPGMGATSAMYDSLRPEIEFAVNFLDWPEYKGETTYVEVAKRLIDENDISDGDIIGGSSLGGMVALEIAQILRPKTTVLLGSAINKFEVQSALSILSPLASVTPISFIQVLVGKHKSLVSKMFSNCDPGFIRAMCLHLPSWPGYSGPNENIFRLHGLKDHVIPCPANGAEIIDGAGHLLAMTHPKETGQFLINVNST